MSTIKVTVWNEFRHEKLSDQVKAIYPEGIHMAIAGYLKNNEDYEVKTAVLDDPEHGLTDDVLDQTDVLIWWGHVAHDEVSDEVVEKVRQKVLGGMGLIVLHSGHASKIFRKLMGTNTELLKWREDGKKERIWVIEPGHPIAAASGNTSKSRMKKCTGSGLKSRRRTSSSSSPGLKAEKCSAAAAATAGGRERSSISDRAMKRSRSIISPKCSK